MTFQEAYNILKNDRANNFINIDEERYFRMSNDAELYSEHGIPLYVFMKCPNFVKRVLESSDWVIIGEEETKARFKKILDGIYINPSVLTAMYEENAKYLNSKYLEVIHDTTN